MMGSPVFSYNGFCLAPPSARPASLGLCSFCKAGTGDGEPRALVELLQSEPQHWAWGRQRGKGSEG